MSKARIKELDARLRAADALADAVEEWMKEGPPPAEVWARMENALAAYREAEREASDE